MTTMPRLPRWRVWPVKLPIQVAVVYDGTPDINTIPPVSASVREAVAFYRDLRIVLQPSIWGVPLGQQDYQDIEANVPREPMLTHAFRLGGAPMTVVYLSHEAHWRQEHLGDSYGGHLAVVAGNHGLAGETLIHEIGHLLLNDPPSSGDHQNGTFMAEAIWNFDSSAVNTQQRTRMYEAAYLLGSF